MSEENQTNENEQATNMPPTTETTTQSPAERFLEKNGVRLEVPENFWDKDANAPDMFAILKSAMDYRNQLGEDTSPKDGVYQINIPEEFKDKLEANPEDPLFKEFSKIAKAKRMSQKEFDAISQIYFKQLYDNTEAFDSNAYYAHETQLLKEKFGNEVDRVKARIDNFVNNSGITDKDILDEIAFMQTSAGGVATLDYLLSLRGEPMPETDYTSKAGQLSLDDLRKMQMEPGYLNGSDKALIEKVTKGYEKLYGIY